jgi:type II secretion system protein G
MRLEARFRLKAPGASVAGFTLIELLIVVAIIGILAAIAIPNFLEAQVRAKAARVKADLRTYGTAIEIYRIDHGKYPSWPDPGAIHEAHCAANGMWPDCNDPVPYLLTTPIAYISDLFDDPFPARPPNPSWEEPPGYFHQNANAERWPSGDDEELGLWFMLLKWRGYTFGPWPGGIPPTQARKVYWEFWSWGPDGEDNGGQGCSPRSWAAGSWAGAYDPSNGTISGGDIARFGP